MGRAGRRQFPVHEMPDQARLDESQAGGSPSVQTAPEGSDAEQPPNFPKSVSARAVELWLEADLMAERCDREWAAVEEADGGQGTASALATAGMSAARRMRAEREAEQEAGSSG